MCQRTLWSIKCPMKCKIVVFNHSSLHKEKKMRKVSKQNYWKNRKETRSFRLMKHLSPQAIWAILRWVSKRSSKYFETSTEACACAIARPIWISLTPFYFLASKGTRLLNLSESWREQKISIRRIFYFFIC